MQEALEDLRETAHYSVDTWIDLKFKDITRTDEMDHKETLNE